MLELNNKKRRVASAIVTTEIEKNEDFRETLSAAAGWIVRLVHDLSPTAFSRGVRRRRGCGRSCGVVLLVCEGLLALGQVPIPVGKPPLLPAVQ